MLSESDRKRHEHLTQKGKIVEFVVQYEMLYNCKWVPIIRYDTAHGYAHKDLINPDGSKEKILIGQANLNEVMNMADRDINENWEKYKDRYLRRIKA